LVGEDLGALSLWELKTGQATKKLEGHEDAVTCAAFSPDGTSVLSGSTDKSIRLWDVGTGREWARLQGHVQRVTFVVFSARGDHALSGSADGTVRWWQLPSATTVP
jgi:WD40 repeat protein